MTRHTPRVEFLTFAELPAGDRPLPGVKEPASEEEILEGAVECVREGIWT